MSLKQYSCDMCHSFLFQNELTSNERQCWHGTIVWYCTIKINRDKQTYIAFCSWPKVNSLEEKGPSVSSHVDDPYMPPGPHTNRLVNSHLLPGVRHWVGVHEGFTIPTCMGKGMHGYTWVHRSGQKEEF